MYGWKKTLSAIGFTLLSAVSTSAQAEVESWYTYWAIGGASIDYGSDVNRLMDEAEAIPGVSRTKLAFDLLGFYWPVKDDRTMIGFVANTTSDSVTDGATTLTITQNLFGLSGMRFFGSEIGDGVFLRGDAGFANATIRAESAGCTSSGCYTLSAQDSSDTGFGYLLGIGYGLPISSGTRILLSLNFADRDIEGDHTNTVGFTVGGLW
jgi:hypothetical protein